jgi:hypothetical protein
MGTDETYVDDSIMVIDPNHQAAPVACDVEHDPVVLKDTGAPVATPYCGR